MKCCWSQLVGLKRKIVVSRLQRLWDPSSEFFNTNSSVQLAFKQDPDFLSTCQLVGIGSPWHGGRGHLVVEMTPHFDEHEFKSSNEKHSFCWKTCLVSKCASLATSTNSHFQVEARYCSTIVLVEYGVQLQFLLFHSRGERSIVPGIPAHLYLDVAAKIDRP